MHFPERKELSLDIDFTEICWFHALVASNRWQAITWTNDDPVRWHRCGITELQWVKFATVNFEETYNTFACFLNAWQWHGVLTFETSFLFLCSRTQPNPIFFEEEEEKNDDDEPLWKKSKIS